MQELMEHFEGVREKGSHQEKAVKNKVNIDKKSKCHSHVEKPTLKKEQKECVKGKGRKCVNDNEERK